MKPLISIKPNEVHIWKYRMLDWSQKFLYSLSGEEKARYHRLHSIENKSRFAQAHTFLRSLLERYTDIPADQIEITHAHNQKPQLRFNNNRRIHFNLAYREDYALVAISDTNLIGVDIERIKRIEHVSSFVTTYFSPVEKERVLCYKNKYDQLAMVFSIWVMKEALVKALGIGLSELLIQFNLCPFLEAPECIPDFDSSNTWHIERFPVADNYKAACAVRTSGAYFKMFDYGHD